MYVVRWLVEHGATIRPDKFGKTPTDDARENEHMEVKGNNRARSRLSHARKRVGDCRWRALFWRGSVSTKKYLSDIVAFELGELWSKAKLICSQTGCVASSTNIRWNGNQFLTVAGFRQILFGLFAYCCCALTSISIIIRLCLI